MNDSETSPVKIIRLDEQGNDLFSRMLSADNLVLGFHVKTSPLTGNLMLYGKAVANSKKTYNVFRMDLDEIIRQNLEKLNKKPEFVDGLRVTDKETVDIVQMVLAGKVNKTLVNLLEMKGGKAIGLSGMDGRLIGECQR